VCFSSWMRWAQVADALDERAVDSIVAHRGPAPLTRPG